MIVDAKKPRILVVDDDTFFLATIGKFLSEQHFTIDTARDAASALDHLNKETCDLVISDIVMPKMDGIGLLRKIRNKHPDLDVVFMTGQANIDTATEAIQLGACDYLLKPVDFGELLWRTNKALEKIRLKKLEREHNKILKQQVLEQGDRLRFLFFGAIDTLVNAIEAKDVYTKGHSLRVTQYSVVMAKYLDLPFKEASNIQLAARLHDVGKLAINDAILNKPGRLTGEEFELVKVHPDSGCEIIGPILEDPVLEIIRHHHENWNGEGYPGSIAGEDIPLGARIVCLADCFDAMTSTRSYHRAMSYSQGYEEIMNNLGSKFDLDLAPQFIEAMEAHLGPDKSKFA